jgi:antitoxin (DNA-binding transcriptional repressor) of toxin-antitoxin stability system
MQKILHMKTNVYTVGEFKSRFSQALECVERGETVAITYGRKHRPVALLVAPSKAHRSKRQLGKFAKKLKVEFAADWKISGEEFLKG